MAETTTQPVDDEATDAATDEVPESFTSESSESFTSATAARDRHRARRRDRTPQAGHRPGPPRARHRSVDRQRPDARDYFPNKVHQQLVNEPFVTLGAEDRFDVIARIHGGGISGQAGALRLAIARALNGIDEEGNRPSLKRAGFLTRDPRAKERKKYGLKKARKAPQYSKR